MKDYLLLISKDFGYLPVSQDALTPETKTWLLNKINAK